jgi:type IV pilus assembly protein PilY1
MNDTTCPADAPSTICEQGQVVRTTTENPVDWGVRNGWYLDFLIGGERSVTDPTLALGTLVFTTIKPQSNTTGALLGCSGEDTTVNAKSYLYYLNYLTGGAVAGTKSVVGEELCVCIATRPSVVKTQSGNVEGIIRTSGGGGNTGDSGGDEGGDGGDTDLGYTNRQNLPVNNAGGATRRISWRELNGD